MAYQNSQLTKDASPAINDDIRVKLRQLREGIGYYEAKSNANRASSNIENTSFEMNPSSRNNASSVLLPELKGSYSPGQYQSNNSIITKK